MADDRQTDRMTDNNSPYEVASQHKSAWVVSMSSCVIKTKELQSYCLNSARHLATCNSYSLKDAYNLQS